MPTSPAGTPRRVSAARGSHQRDSRSAQSDDSDDSDVSILPAPWSAVGVPSADVLHVQHLRLSASTSDDPQRARSSSTSANIAREASTPPTSTQSAHLPWPGRTHGFLRRYSPLALPVAMLVLLIVLLVDDLAAAQSSSDAGDANVVDANVTAINWSACALDNAVADVYDLAAQCATVALPLCYAGVCQSDDDARIGVFFKRIASTSRGNKTASAQTVWYLPDRPDVQPASAVELQMALLYQALAGDVDVYSMHLRGSGNSSALRCSTSGDSPLQQAIDTPNDGVVDVADVEACVATLQSRGLADLRAFSLTSAAMDVQRVVTTFQPHAHAVVYALGYGSLVAQRLMQLGVSQITGYVLDGVLPDVAAAGAFAVSRGDEAFGHGGDAFVASCQLDAECAAQFPSATPATTLNATLREVYARLDADVASVCASLLRSAAHAGLQTPPSFVLRQLLAHMTLSATLRPFVPVVAFRFHRCGSEDLTLLAELATSVLTTTSAAPDLLYAIQAFSELWEQPTPDQTQLTQRFTRSVISDGRAYTLLDGYCAFSGDASAACVNASTAGDTSSSASTLTYTRDAWASNASAAVVPSGASVLLLSGGLDALSPLQDAQRLYDSLQGEAKAMLVAPSGTHGVVQSALLADGTACGRQVLASYVRSGGDLGVYDASCMRDVPTPSLAISNVSSLLLLGVADAYNGELVRSASASASASGGLEIAPDVGADSAQASASASGSTRSDSSQEIRALEASRNSYRLALIVVASVLGALLLLGLAALCYRRHRRKQLADEEAMLRRMRGDEDDELELMRSLYLLSSSSPSARASRHEDSRSSGGAGEA